MENSTLVSNFTLSGLNESKTNKNIYFSFTLLLYPLMIAVNLTLMSVKHYLCVGLTLTNCLNCDNWSIVNLSCAATTLNSAYNFILIIAQLAQDAFIIYTYIRIVRACLKSIEQRSKFMQTCLPHLMALINFILATLFDVMYSRYGSITLSQSLWNIMAVEFLVTPPPFSTPSYTD
ncbi:O52N5 protein, partial [Amia calva]|nr:O52N5 protein [Amia calva]